MLGASYTQWAATESRLLTRRRALLSRCLDAPRSPLHSRFPHFRYPPAQSPLRPWLLWTPPEQTEIPWTARALLLRTSLHPFLTRTHPTRSQRVRSRPSNHQAPLAHPFRCRPFVLSEVASLSPHMILQTCPARLSRPQQTNGSPLAGFFRLATLLLPINPLIILPPYQESRWAMCLLLGERARARGSTRRAHGPSPRAAAAPAVLPAQQRCADPAGGLTIRAWRPQI